MRMERADQILALHDNSVARARFERVGTLISNQVEEGIWQVTNDLLNFVVRNAGVRFN